MGRSMQYKRDVVLPWLTWSAKFRVLGFRPPAAVGGHEVFKAHVLAKGFSEAAAFAVQLVRLPAALGFRNAV